MKLRNNFWIALFAVLVATTSGASSVQATGVTWTTSLSSAMATAKKTGKPILVNFSAKWCVPCEVMEKTTFRDAKVVAESKKWIMVYIDIDKQEKLATRYKIAEYPTIMLMNRKGKIVAQAKGIADIKTTSSFLKWWQPNYKTAKK